MSYDTNLGNGLTVTSKDVRLSRQRIERRHDIMGTKHKLVVWEDRSSGRSTLYVDGHKYRVGTTLTQAYDTARLFTR